MELLSQLQSISSERLPSELSRLHDSRRQLLEEADRCQTEYDTFKNDTAYSNVERCAATLLHSIASQVHDLTKDFTRYLDLGNAYMSNVVAEVDEVCMMVAIHKEKQQRKSVGTVLIGRSNLRSSVVVAPTARLEPKKFKPAEGDFSVLDNIGHCMKATGTLRRRPSTLSVGSTSSGYQSNAAEANSLRGFKSGSMQSSGLSHLSKTGSSSSLGSATSSSSTPTLVGSVVDISKQNCSSSSFPAQSSYGSSQGIFPPSTLPPPPSSLATMPSVHGSHSSQFPPQPPPPPPPPVASVIPPPTPSPQHPPPPPPNFAPPRPQAPAPTLVFTGVNQFAQVSAPLPRCQAPPPPVVFPPTPAMHPNSGQVSMTEHNTSYNPPLPSPDFLDIPPPDFLDIPPPDFLDIPPPDFLDIPPPPFLDIPPPPSDDQCDFPQPPSPAFQSPVAEPPNYIMKVRAIYSYTRANPDELGINPGDILYVTLVGEDGWYGGLLNGVFGMFPGNYVTKI